MKHLLLATALLTATGCATSSPLSPDMTARKAPMESVRVTVANVEIPVTVVTIPLHSSLELTNSPTREHIRRLMLATHTP